LGSPTGLPALRTVALIVTVPVGSPGTSAKPTLLPFGTAVAERRVRITAIAALIHGVGAWGQLNLAISAVAVPADRQPNIVDIGRDRLLNDDCHPGRRTPISVQAASIGATTTEQQEKQLGTSYERSGLDMRHR
jgi:hypothetical protein